MDLLAVHRTLKSLLQHHSSNESVFCHSAFLMVQLSHPYMTTGKNHSLTIRIFVGKVMSLLFNMLSRLVTAFLPRRRLYSPWNSLGQNTGVGSLSLLQGIFPIQGSNLRLQHWQDNSLPLVPPHFMGNRWGNSGNSVRLYFGGLQNHCRW